MRRILMTLLIGGLSLSWVAAGASADNTRGECNSILAKGLGTVNKLNRGKGDTVKQCASLAGNLAEFMVDGCFDLFLEGDLSINKSSVLGGDSERLSPLGESLCSALVDECGLPLPNDICESQAPTQ
jgi:hypothetical protein